MLRITVSNIITAFKKPGESYQIKMIKSLTKLGSVGRDMLILIWNTSDKIDVRRWAIHGLGNFKDTQSKSFIKSALSDPSMSIRLHAIRAIRILGDKKLASNTKELINDSSGGIRVNALDVIVQLQVPGFCKVIEKCLGDPKKYVRDRASYYKKTAT